MLLQNAGFPFSWLNNAPLCVLHSDCKMYILANNTRLLFSPHDCQHFLSLVFLMTAILTVVGCYLIVVLICTF